MIFVTVGTHEQSFNRLLEEIDRLADVGLIADNGLFIQSGYSTYQPKHGMVKAMWPHDEMHKMLTTADLVISHGGASTFMTSINSGVKTIVVPRQRRFGEHVNDHQKEFMQNLGERGLNIAWVDDISELEAMLTSSDEVPLPPSNTANFLEAFKRRLSELPA